MNFENPNSSDTTITTSLPSIVMQKTKLHLNLDQDAILTTEDKVRLILLNHLQRLEKKKSWIAPAGILMTILTAITTTKDFKDLWLKAETWEAIFMLAGVGAFIWLVVAIIQALRAPGIDDIVSELKKSGQQSEKTSTSMIKLPNGPIPQDIFPGKWENTFTKPGQNAVVELFEIREGNKYFVNGNDHRFNIIDVQLDEFNGTLSFTKERVGSGPEKRFVNKLKKISWNHYEGLENDQIKVVYKKIS